jgi:hypothetical protein
MIYEIDHALRELLIREMPMKKGEVEIAFEQPKRDWSARLNKPTLNFFLFDLRENVELRGSEQWDRQDNPDGTVTLKRNPVRLDLQYLVTSWARDIQDEHRLLSAALTALLRQPVIPEDLLPDGLKGQSAPIRLNVAQGNSMSNVTELWSTLDNDLHPGIRLTVTFSVDPYQPVTFTAVRTTEVRFFQNPNPDAVQASAARAQEVPAASLSRSAFLVNGQIVSNKYSPSALKLILAETGGEIEILEDGSFKIGRLREGEYNLDVIVNDRVLKRQKLQVPSVKYEIKI